MKNKKENLIVYFFIIVLFSSFITLTLIGTISAQEGGTTDIADPLPTPLLEAIPANTLMPIQAAWDPHKNDDPTFDLANEKPHLVVVYVPSLAPPDNVFYDVKNVAGIVLYSFTSPVDTNNMAFIAITPSTEDRIIEITFPGGIPAATISRKTTRDLSLYYEPINGGNNFATISDEDFKSLVEESNNFMNLTYPVDGVDFKTGSGFNSKKDLLGDIFEVFARATKKQNNKEIGIAVVEQAYFMYLNDTGNILIRDEIAGASWGPSVKGVIICNNYPTAAAHEVGHVFDLYFGDEDEQYKDNQPYGIEATGVDTTAQAWRWGYDFMGVSFFDTTDYSWVISDPTYNTLFDALSEQSVDPEVVVVSGVFSDNGTTFEMPADWLRFDNGTISNNIPPGDYAIRFIDNNNNTLGTDFSFDVQYYVSIDPGVVYPDPVPSTGVGNIATDEAPFCFAVGVPSGQKKAIQVIDTGNQPERVVVEVPWDDIKSGEDTDLLGWIIGGIVVATLVGGVVVYLATRP